MYGEPTNPIPYIAAAYLSSALLIFGYAIWLFAHRRKIQTYLEILSSPDAKVAKAHTLTSFKEPLQ